jgi:hypothetical protein
MTRMPLGRRQAKTEPNAGFDWREIVCDSETSAKAEAERQQSMEDADEVEWIHLKSDKTGHWLARRTPRNVQGSGDSSLWEAFVEQVLNPFQFQG